MLEALNGLKVDVEALEINHGSMLRVLNGSKLMLMVFNGFKFDAEGLEWVLSGRGISCPCFGFLVSASGFELVLIDVRPSVLFSKKASKLN